MPTTFEDFEVGTRMRHARGVTVGEYDNALISRMVMNTAQAHWNEEHLRDSPLGDGRVVFGLITASIVVGLASQDTADDAIEEVGLDSLRFVSPVHHGDTLFAYTEVLRRDADRDDSGVVRFKHWGVLGDGRVVFEGERLVRLRRRAAAVAT